MPEHSSNEASDFCQKAIQSITACFCVIEYALVVQGAPRFRLTLCHGLHRAASVDSALFTCTNNLRTRWHPTNRFGLTGSVKCWPGGSVTQRQTAKRSVFSKHQFVWRAECNATDDAGSLVPSGKVWLAFFCIQSASRLPETPPCLPPTLPELEHPTPVPVPTRMSLNPPKVCR